MIKIEKACLKHFEAVYRLLVRIDDRCNSKNDWKNLFIDHFNSGETYSGYSLLDNDKVVGFLGLIFAKRTIGDSEIKFCNITSWIVLKEYRNRSMALLRPVLKLNNYVLTNFTASKTVGTILKTLKFKELGKIFIIISPLPNIAVLKLLFTKKVRIIYGNKVKEVLGKDELRIFFDHSLPDFRCKHVVIKDVTGTCYIVSTRAFRKRIPFLHIHYVSNAEIFAKYVDIFRMIAPFKFKVAGIIMDKRFLKGERIKYVINCNLQSPRFYKSNLTNSPKDLDKIDHLYSEFVVLNI